ncbi:VWA-like domain-containing protein (plasmid) [Shewanella xiamenensis]|uniref:VWA-like domain-containing protein n=2 Tax=Shewanella xiamenensis TaxID=332186 RepID=A0ABT6UJ38_9GAMM|nr:VWA-like domain-containing protein [Shewanella xiamenensis]MDI5833309.1 VWA-like domain-containing protein [Shewanella xiamenensis]WHF57941.1 VWA-like domain-containing protein [Shewanella xiamenensis]
MNEIDKFNESLKSQGRQGTLNTNPLLQSALNRFRTIFSSMDQYGLPRFGMLSLMATTTPMFIYDHPKLMEKVNTAFAIPGAVFISADLFNNLLAEDKLAKDRGVKSDGVMFVIAHEMEHIVRNHLTRCLQFSSDLANIGQDIRINLDLWKGFTMEPGTYLRDTIKIYGITDEEATKFQNMPEELICLILEEEARNQANRKNETKKSNAQQSSAGQPQNPQQSGGGQSQNPQQSGGGQSQNPQQSGGGESQNPQQSGGGESQNPQQSGTSKPQSGNSKVPSLPKYENLDQYIGSKSSDKNHTMSIEDFTNFINENGLDSVLEKLGIPKDNLDGGIDKLNQRFQDQILESYNTAKQYRLNNKNGHKMAGMHTEDALEYRLEQLNQPKLNIKTVLRDTILGDGMSFKVNEDMPTALFSVDPTEMGIEFPVYEAAVEPSENMYLPTAMLIDTSGSIYSDKETITQFFSEAIGILEDNENAVVYVFAADTAVRGKPIILSKDTLEDCVNNLPVRGGGGTEFTGPINAVMNWMSDNAFDPNTGIPVNCGAIIYMTDLEAAPPKKENLVDDLPPVLFICKESDFNPDFANRVSNFATVHTLNVAKELDLNAMYNENEEEKGLQLK